MAKKLMQKNLPSKRWCKPPEGWVKINTDARCQQRTGSMGVGCVIRDDMGQFIRARNKVIHGHMQSREVEAISLREALSWTKDWRRSKCIFECDAKRVLEAVKAERDHSYFDTIIEDHKDILKHFTEVLVLFCSRSANTIAHLLAQATGSMSGSHEWLDTAPEFIMCCC